MGVPQVLTDEGFWLRCRFERSQVEMEVLKVLVAEDLRCKKYALVVSQIEMEEVCCSSRF